MYERRFLKKILWIELTALLLIIGFLWMDELFDLPHHLFGANPTPANLPESLFETVIILGLVAGACFFHCGWRLHFRNQSMRKID